MTLPIVINGPHVGNSVGFLQGANGQLVSIWSYSPADLLEAMTEAIGPVPYPPSLGLGGSVKTIYPADPLSKDPPQVIYDPSGDEVNKDLVALFQAQVSAWNARADVIQKAITVFLSNKPKDLP